MKKIFDRLTALVMVMLMFIQSCVPAITSFAKEEELDKRYVIQKLETLKQDTYANFSLNLATVIDDKNLDTDTNVKFVLNTTNVNSNIKLLVRKDFSLYDERTFDTVEEAHKEFDRVDKSLKDQGLSLDVSVVQEDGKYRIHNNYVPQADKEDFGDDYKVYSLKVVDEFDFDKEGLFNKLPENLKSTEQHRLQLAEERRLQQDGEVPEGDKHNRTYIFDFKVDKAVDTKLTTIALNKDENNPVEVKQTADLFAAILDDKTYSVYQTEQLPAEVTSSIEHKKEVAKKKAEADAKAKAEADAKAKKEADEKAKKEAEEKAKKNAKAKEEADAKAKQEADKLKAEEAKKTEEQKALEEKEKAEADAKAKQEADAKAKAEAEKLKAEAEAKQKAEAEAKAKQEQLAKEQAEAEAKKAAEEKAKKDLENKKLLGLEKDIEENQEEEPIIKKKETTEEVKSEPATPEERKQKAEEFDKALQDKKEDIKKSEDKKDANNKEDNNKKTDNKEVSKETKGLLEGIKEFFGFSNLQKADRELKAILSVKANGLKEVQALLSSFEDKYHLTKQEQAKLMDDNADAIKALIEKDADKNFNPQMLFAQTRGANDLNLDGKKFTIITEYDISNKNGPVQKGQSFTIHLDDKLTVNDGSTLPSIKYNNEVIATPKYNSNNTITYTLTKNIDQNIQVPLNIPVDYNIGNITLDDDGTFTVINKVTGIGVNNPPKDLVPQKVDKNGNPAGSIIEPGRDDVTQIVDSSKNYRLDIDSVGNPVIGNGEMVGINWVVQIESSKDLKNDLGMKMNFTLVEGSGLEKIESITSSDSTEKLQDNAIKGNTGIVDSKHSVINKSTKSYRYSIYTPISNKQAAYVLDISTVLTKDVTDGQPYVGAVRSVMDKGYPKDKVEQVTPTRVGINNRTTIEGKFLSNTQAQWTITDGVCTLDKNNGLPLETRTLEGANVKTGKRVVYGVDPTTGKMVVKEQEKGLTSIPAKEKEPEGTQAVGNIGVYQFTHDVDESTTPKSYTMSGVKISKFQDLYIDQEWNLPEQGMTMPAQYFIAKDNKGNELGKVHVDPGQAGEKTRFVTISNARYWDIDGTTHEPSKRGNKIEQKFDQDTVNVGNKTYKYNENANYYQIDTKSQYIHNSAIDTTKPKPVTFTVVKVDSKDPSKKLSGATFKLLGDNQSSVITDSQGKATFSNVLPGTYTLTEEKAPAGYKLDQSQKTITISNDGKISVNGSNIQSSGRNETKLVQHNSAPNWPDYMNAMHYGKISDNSELEFYLYLKPESNNGKDGTNRNTRLNISIPGGNITEVTAYDVSPGYRQNVKYNMEKQSMDKYVSSLGNNVIGASNNNKIIGTANKTDPYTGKTGYQIYFPQERFANDWGFLVKVKASVGNKQSVSLDYDWLTNEDTANQTKLTQNVIINKASGETGENQLIVPNEEFTKSPITITKFGDTFDENGNRNKLQGAEFVLKDSNRKTIANKITNDKGEADFGNYPPGTYRLEEAQAPDGYEKNGVYFEVVVDDKGQVKYNPRFEDGIGTPQAGHDYYIEKGQETGTAGKAKVTNVNQRLEYLENEPGDIGTKTGVWEAYSYESLKYHADITLSGVSQGSRFEIQFDRNLDFTQYFSKFPKIVIDGKEVADPYFDFNTNLLTYVFNDKLEKNKTTVTASINLRGIIPDKYYAKETGQYPFTIKVAPGQTGTQITGNPNLTEKINADYGRHHSETGDSNQSYYFRDVYQKEDGKWYVTVLTYLNPLGVSYSAKTVKYNWITTDFQSNRIAEWSGKGYEPLYKLDDVKVYGTDYGKYMLGDLPLNKYMPLSMGIRPEQDPNIYHLLAHQTINPDQNLDRKENDITIIYDPTQIQTNKKLNANSPLIVKTPKPRDKGGYVIEQTFKITDIDQFNKKWRAFLMNDGNLTSAFASKANVNTAIGDQAGGEIPKYYKEIVGLINNKYTPGSFKLTKYDEANQGKKLPNATFALKDEDGKVIYRTSDANGVVNFENIAPGRYSLEETRSPKGYQLTNKKWQVTVLSDGSVRIRETSVTGASKLYTDKDINIQVADKPAVQKFRVYKKDGKGQPLAGAKFKITDPEDSNFSAEAESGTNGIVEFDATLVEGKNYILEEVEPPKGYNPLNKKWVLRVEDGKTKVYNYSEKDKEEEKDVVKSILAVDGVEWVDAKNRDTSNWSDYDNRWTGWAGNNQNAQYLGTRIIAINKKDGYAIQRYVINPEARNIEKTTASIHRQSVYDNNMDWFDINKFDKANDIKVYKLDRPVTELISDIRYANYKPEDITESVINTSEQVDGRYGEPKRLQLDIPATNKPIVIDIKVPYKNEDGGVGTGMDWTENGTTYWKADYYERVSDIKTTGPTTSTGGTIVGSYVSEGSLDVTNSLKTYGFKIKKVKDDKKTAIPGAVFKLTGPDPLIDERYMTTDKDGMLSFSRLEPGTYKLEEFKPAPGYEKANTDWTVRITKDGKVYIKDNKKQPAGKDANAKLSVEEAASSSPANRIRQYLAQNSSSLHGVDTGLEFGPELVDAALRAGDGWEIVDNTSSTQPEKREDASDSDYGQLIDTKIIEIDKENNRYKQVFIYKEGYAKKNRNIKFHRAYDKYNISPSEVTTRVFQVPDNTSLANINESSDIDAIAGKTDISRNVRFTQDGTKKIQTTNINTKYPGTILIEVETNYYPNQLIGLGSNYDFNPGSQSAYGHKCWLEKSYANEAGVPVVKTTVYHTIKFDGNGGTGTMTDGEAVEGKPYTLPANGFTAPANKKFEGWEVNGQIYQPGASVRLTSDTTIKAIWKSVQVNVSFDNGGGTGNMDTVQVDKGSNYKLPDNKFDAPEGKEFKAWSVNGNEFQPGQTVPVNADTIIIAVWQKKAPTEATITFSPGEGTGTMPNQTFKIGSSYNLPTPSFTAPAGKKFAGWLVDGKTFPAGEAITVKNNMTIVAQWKDEGFKINIDPNIQNGQIITNPTSAKEGVKVIVTATANDGFELSSITVTDAQGKTVTVTNNSFTMPAGDVTVSATFNKADMGTEIPKDGFAQITNKQVGLDLKIYKKDRYDRKLEGAIFTIRKTDEKYEKFDQDFGVKTGASNAEGLVEFKDDKGNIINLQEGYYVIEETAAPLGYRHPNAPWKVQVVEENGQLVAKYKGPEETPQSFVEKNENLDIKEANGVKYATKITHIDTESRSFVQRVYIDTRGKDGVVNVQIKPKHKREEIDRAGLPPVTIKEGVKTAYRSTYKITGLNGDPDQAQMIKILNDYDVSTPNVTVVNTARWRPFDWGFDEDQLNLEPGVYYIDIEGFYDTSIIDRNVTNEVAIDSNYNFTKKDGVTPSTEPVLKDQYKLTAADIPDEDLGKLDINIEFYDGAREFQQAYNYTTIDYKAIKDENGKDEASYQGGAEAIRKYIEYYSGKVYADDWAKKKPAGQKYVNALSKKVKINEGGNDYVTGKIVPPVATATPSSKISTSMDISPLYSSNATNTVPQEGLSVVNDAERYNITFSKHGKDYKGATEEEITKRRLEGAVFKLEKRVREGIYEELEGSYVSSAFNGYFGFRGLEPGRYRLVEVQAPKGYQPINGPLLYFSVETVSIVSQRVTDPRTGENTNVNDVEFYFPDNKTPYKFADLEMHDPVTNKVIKFKDSKNADLETTRIINPLDKSKEVPLRDLSMKFPDVKNSAGEILIESKTYKISQIQITPTSNGYISLEYDKANGVYQYIPEKSTSVENGKLVDYVTSATAKNMGKIVNEKPGKGNVTINKVDEKGNALKGTENDKGELTAGAKFRLTNLTDGSKPIEKIVGTDGKLTFEGLKIGNYKLEEIESPDGHINTKQVWHFTVGGEGLDPYSGDIARTGDDLSDKITLETTEMKVLNPKYEKPTKEGEIHPHYGESMEFTNKFKLAENTKINPGDYFVLNISDNIDLHGIFENSISNLDIVADGVGTIAKADYDRKAGTLTYTFTKYADTYTLIDFSNKLTAFIDLYDVKQSDRGLSGVQKVGFGIGEDTKQYKDIKVIYDLSMEKDNNGTDYMNMTSKIVKYNQKTGEFVHYYYINRDKENARTNSFYYIPSLDVENVVITKYRLVNNTNVEEDMPESFGLNENSSNLLRIGYGVSRQSMAKGQLLELPFENGISNKDSYIVKVTGKVSGTDKSSYQAEGVLQRYDYYEGKLFVDRYDGVYGFRNESTADVKLSIQAVNPSNIIKFKKINNANEALKGAIFQLYKKNNDGNPDSYGQPITTGEDGLIEYSKLPKGEYQLKETTAPDGYVKPDGPLAEFKVDDNGNIFRKEYYKDNEGQTQEKYIEEPGVVPINLINDKENEIVFKKVDGKDNAKVLEGAEFQVLYKQVKDAEYPENSIKLYKDKDGIIYAFKADEVPSGYTEVEGNKLTSGKDGIVKFKVRSNGYYALKEVKAPAGYINPKGIVKEFAVLDGKVQTEKYKTEMDVNKTKSGTYANGWHNEYLTSIALRFNPNHEDITYVKDKSKISLSGLPLENEFFENNVGAKTGVTIKAYTVDKENGIETFVKSYKVDLNNYDNYKGKETIDLYDLVKGDTTDGSPVKSDKTLVFKMSPQIGLTTKLEIKSNIVIGDKIKEDRTYHIGTKGEEYVDHSYKFTTMGELTDLGTNPIQVENHKATFPHTGAMGIFGFLIAGAIIMTTSYYKYRKKKRGRALS